MALAPRFDVTVGPFTFQTRELGPKDGRPVILLHGVPQTSACWAAQMEALAGAGHRAVAFTQRGYSPGARIDDISAFTLDKLAEDVLGVADALGIGTFDVVGHDAGAGVAWTLAGYYADRIETVTIGSVPHPAAFGGAYKSSKDDGGDSQHERSGYMRQIVKGERGEMEKMFANPDMTKMMFAGLPEESVNEYIEVLGTPEAMRGVLDWYRAGALKDYSGPRGMDPNFPKIDLPTLYIWSDNDVAIGAAGAYATGDYITGPYKFVVFEGVDHWVQEREPERFSNELLEHLAKFPRRS